MRTNSETADRRFEEGFLLGVDLGIDENLEDGIDKNSEDGIKGGITNDSKTALCLVKSTALTQNPSRHRGRF
jgi:hypothetical protein